MNKVLFAFVCGVVFAVGLLVAQMTNPARVIGFLDVTGAWDPTLAFVMAGALVMFGLAYQWSRRAGAKPLLDGRFYVPGTQGITWQLVTGSLLFGVGWGLAGFCPGPALVSAGFGDDRVWIFIAAMTAGALAFNWTRRKSN